MAKGNRVSPFLLMGKETIYVLINYIVNDVLEISYVHLAGLELLQNVI